MAASLTWDYGPGCRIKIMSKSMVEKFVGKPIQCNYG